MKNVKLFLIINFSLTWLIAFILMLNGSYSSPFANVFLIFYMMMPALSVVITTFITKDKFQNTWIKVNFRKNIKYYILAWLLPVILIILGGISYYLIFPTQFDLNMTSFIASTKEQLSSVNAAIPNDSELKKLLILQVGTSVLLAPILNFIPCFGEEFGWRGYLLPNLLKKYSPFKATLITSIIWGIWHAPIIAMGHNYGTNYPTYPIGGILAMIVFCIFLGAILSYFSIKVKSCFPATIGHAMINGFASAPILFMGATTYNNFIGPLPVGIIGGSFIIIAGSICMKLISKMDINKIELSYEKNNKL